MNFDREKFFASYRQRFGPLKQSHVDALNDLLDAIEGDESINDLRHVAYILATIHHETYIPRTQQRYEPVEETGRGRGKEYGKKDRETGQTYYGRGYVQLTWKENYQKLGDILGIDLVNEPELALDPGIAWKITSIGMRLGLFTRRKLSHFINDSICDYRNARQIINRMDKADLIAGYAQKFEQILNASELPYNEPEAEKPTLTPSEPELTVASEPQPAENAPTDSLDNQIPAIKIAKDNSGKLANWMVGAAASGTLAGFWQQNQTLIIAGFIILAVMVLAIYLVNRAMKLYEAKTAASKELNTIQFVSKN